MGSTHEISVTRLRCWFDNHCKTSRGLPGQKILQLKSEEDAIDFAIKSLHPISKSLLADGTLTVSFVTSLFMRVNHEGLIGLCAQMHPIMVYVSNWCEF